MGEVHLRRGDHDAARRCFMEVLPVVREFGHKERIPDVLCNIGATFLAQGRIAEAVSYHRQAVVAAREANLGRKLAGYLIALADACGRAGREDEAMALRNETAALERQQ
jgi:tetratricopeptide (TPR) repeat protein